MKFDLGGTGSGGSHTTVNLIGEPDICCDIALVDRYVPLDGTVEEFRLSHTLEHIPSEHYVEFLLALRRKLRVGGILTVIQTDAAAVLEQYQRGELGFRAMRSTLFPPADRLRLNSLNRHQQMWSADELRRDLEALGFLTEKFDAGTWPLDTVDELFPEEVIPLHGTPIRNLGVRGTKPGIPKIIHQTWKTTEIPADIFDPEWGATWEELEGFEYRLWTDADNRALVAEHYPWFLETYDAYDVPIKQVDAARYFILHHHGGIYVDLDFLRLRPLDSLTSVNDLILGWENSTTVGNAIMGCARGHPIMTEAITRLAICSTEHVLNATGPAFLTRVVQDSQHLPEILPSQLLYPYPWNDPKKSAYRRLDLTALRERFPDALAVTHWTGTWLDEPS